MSGQSYKIPSLQDIAASLLISFSRNNRVPLGLQHTFAGIAYKDNAGALLL